MNICIKSVPVIIATGQKKTFHNYHWLQNWKETRSRQLMHVFTTVAPTDGTQLNS